jgi:cellulose synthase/poly-beta-1,6-N-acetylglucosamine synthase-like glycosyltransferase
MFPECDPNVASRFPERAPNVPCTFPECAPNVPRTFPKCAPNVPCMSIFLVIGPMGSQKESFLLCDWLNNGSHAWWLGWLQCGSHARAHYLCVLLYCFHVEQRCIHERRLPFFMKLSQEEPSLEEGSVQTVNHPRDQKYASVSIILFYFVYFILFYFILFFYFISFHFIFCFLFFVFCFLFLFFCFFVFLFLFLI